MTRAAELALATRREPLAALAWRRPDAPRVLCLHGWLDNAASFVPLAGLLDRFDLVALDLPGHGHSAHRHPHARYHFIDYLWNVDDALESLGWDDCHLLGHSLGAAIAAMYAAAATRQVRSLVLLDSLGPLTAPASGAAQQLRRSLAENRRPRSPLRQFGSLDEMIAARRGSSDLSEAAARLICERAAIATGGGWQWRSDPALNRATPLYMTEEQALDILRHIQAPVLSLTLAGEAHYAPPEQTLGRKQAIAHGRHLSVQGHHHFHMDDPAAIASTVVSFILEHDQQPQHGRPDAKPDQA